MLLSRSRPKLNEMERISQESFIETANYRLGLAQDSERSSDEIYWSAAFIKGELGRISTGELEVVPPIGREQLDDFSKRADLIISDLEQA